ncbi:unnamed protein product [Closterium sp. NIES-53]
MSTAVTSSDTAVPAFVPQCVTSTRNAAGFASSVSPPQRLGSFWKPIGLSHCQSSDDSIQLLKSPSPNLTPPFTLNSGSHGSSDSSSRHDAETLRVPAFPSQHGPSGDESAPNFATTPSIASQMTAQNQGATVRAIDDVELWHACAGPLVTLPAVGSVVVYFPEGHVEQQQLLAETRSASCSASDEAQRQWDPQHAAPHNTSSAAAAGEMRDGGSASSGDCAGARGSSHDEGSDAATAALPPSHMFCRLESLVLQIDVETHELLATMQLQPIQEAEAAEEQARAARAGAAASGSRVLYARTEQDRVCCKRLSTSDTSTHGGFSIPRKAAEACLPHLDMTQSVPSQRITATDVLGNQWLFRHVYRGTPKRHLLTTGWSALSATWGLAAGDRIVFLRNRHGALKVAVRRSEAAMAALQAQRQARHAQRCSLDVDHVGGPAAMAPSAASPGLAEVASADAVLAAAARCYSRRTAFSVTFHPWVSASTPFVIPLPDFTRGLHVKAALQPGSEVRLTLETDDLATRRLRGTVLSLHHSPSATWPSSPWRSVQIKWGDTDGAVKPTRLSPWLLDDARTLAQPCSSFYVSSGSAPLSTTFASIPPIATVAAGAALLSHSAPRPPPLSLPPLSIPTAAPMHPPPGHGQQHQHNQQKDHHPQQQLHCFSPPSPPGAPLPVPASMQTTAAAPAAPLAAGQHGNAGSWGPTPLRLSTTAPLSHTPLTSFLPNHSLPPRLLASEHGCTEPDAMVWSHDQPAMEYSGSPESVTTATPATAATAGAGCASPAAPRPAFPRTLTAPGGFTAYAPASARHGGVKREQQEEGAVHLTLSLGLSALTASPPSDHSAPIFKRRRTTGLALPVLRHACHSESDVARLLRAERPERTDTLDNDLSMPSAGTSAAHADAAGGAGGAGVVAAPHGCLFTLPSSPSSASGGTPRSSSKGEVECAAMEERAASGEREAAGGAESMDGQTVSPSKQAVSPCKLSPPPSRAANRRRIKLRVEGSPVGRTVDLSGIGSFQSLYATCAAMLQLPLQQPSEGATCPWQLTYTDADGDTLLVGDGPWSVFLEHVHALTVMKAPM